MQLCDKKHLNKKIDLRFLCAQMMFKDYFLKEQAS